MSRVLSVWLYQTSRVFSSYYRSSSLILLRVEKREFTWEFPQFSLLDQMRTRVAWELRSESLHESFLIFHCLIKREQEWHQSWQARVYMWVFSTFIAWSNENKSCSQSWQARVYMWVFSTFTAWSNGNKNCMRVDESWEARVCIRVFSTLMPRSNENKIKLHEIWQAKVYMRVFSTFIAWSNEKSCMRVDESWQARVCMRVSCPGQTQENLNQLKVFESCRECTRVGGETRSRDWVATSHQLPPRLNTKAKGMAPTVPLKGNPYESATNRAIPIIMYLL
jgi:hypothetical protein